MDFKALSVAILNQLMDPTADKEYIAAKLRACIDNDVSALYDVIDTKNKSLQEKHNEARKYIHQLTDDNDQLRIKLADMDTDLLTIERLKKEKQCLEEQIRAKDDHLARAESTFNQMNEYIQKSHAEIVSLKESLKSANDELDNIRKINTISTIRGW
jgi:chromosome segregation ATPase